MFTGLVEEIGVLISVQPVGGGRKLTIRAGRVMDDLRVDNSIALNGVCQTVVSRSESTFTVVAVEETLRKTTVGAWRPGVRLNLERAVRPADRLGGHIVQGHVDGVGTLVKRVDEATNVLLMFRYPAAFAPLLVPVGSICVDGVSLTVARLEGETFTVAIIPYTLGWTTLGERKVGDSVNLEFDIIGKYIQRQMSLGTAKTHTSHTASADSPGDTTSTGPTGSAPMSLAWLAERGFGH